MYIKTLPLLFPAGTPPTQPEVAAQTETNPAAGTYVRVCVCACVRVCLYVRMYVCVCVFVYVNDLVLSSFKKVVTHQTQEQLLQSLVHMCAVIAVFRQIKVIVDIITSGLFFTSCFNLTLPMLAPAPQPLPGIRVAGGCLFCFLCSQPPCFDSCSYLSPGESCLRKRSPEGTRQDQPPAKRVAVTGSKGSVEAVGVSSSAPVVSRGAGAAESSPPICEGELYGVSFPSMRLGWKRPCLLLSWLSSVEWCVLCRVRTTSWCMCLDVSPHL